MKVLRGLMGWVRIPFVRDILLFALLIGSFHYIYCFWSSSGFYPFKEQVDALFVASSRLLFDQTTHILSLFPDLHFYTHDQTVFVTGHSGKVGYVAIEPGCTSLKQWMHWLFLMILFPGPWRHKWWYIPSGLLIIHGINVVRMTGLALTLAPWPEHFHFFHDYVFKGMFYFVIFCMWLLWVEFFSTRVKPAAAVS